MPIIMQKGRWSKTDTVMRYVEHISLLHKQPRTMLNHEKPIRFKPG